MAFPPNAPPPKALVMPLKLSPDSNDSTKCASTSKSNPVGSVGLHTKTNNRNGSWTISNLPSTFNNPSTTSPHSSNPSNFPAISLWHASHTPLVSPSGSASPPTTAGTSPANSSPSSPRDAPITTPISHNSSTSTGINVSVFGTTKSTLDSSPPNSSAANAGLGVSKDISAATNSSPNSSRLHSPRRTASDINLADSSSSSESAPTSSSSSSTAVTTNARPSRSPPPRPGNLGSFHPSGAQTLRHMSKTMCDESPPKMVDRHHEAPPLATVISRVATPVPGRGSTSTNIPLTNPLSSSGGSNALSPSSMPSPVPASNSAPSVPPPPRPTIPTTPPTNSTGSPNISLPARPPPPTSPSKSSNVPPMPVTITSPGHNNITQHQSQVNSTLYPPPAPPLPSPDWIPPSARLHVHAKEAKQQKKKDKEEQKKKEKEEKKALKDAQKEKKIAEKEEKKALKESKKNKLKDKDGKPITISGPTSPRKPGSFSTSPVTTSGLSSPTISNNNSTIFISGAGLTSAPTSPAPPTPGQKQQKGSGTPPQSPSISHMPPISAPQPLHIPFILDDPLLQQSTSPKSLLHTLANAEEYGGTPRTMSGGNKQVLQPVVSPTPPPVATPQHKVGLSDFRVIKLIGKGGYGEVYLVEHTSSKKKMALKVLDKSRISSKEKADQIVNERAVLVQSAQNPFLLSLNYSFQDAKYLYFAMKYCPGGDLRALLSAIGAFEEDEAKLYMAEMIVSVDALHQLGYIHRDLKPDNFLIDEKGHLILADFGLSKGLPPPTTPPNTPAVNQSNNLSNNPDRGHARDRSLSTISKPPPLSSKSPSMLLGLQPFERLNAQNVEQRFTRTRRRNPVLPLPQHRLQDSNATNNGHNDTSPFSDFTYGGPTTEVGHFVGTPSFGMSTFGAASLSNPNAVRPIIQLLDLPPSRQNRRLMAYSVVGSPDYMSPEVLAEHGYGYEVDWWSIGCLCFELVLGIPPFTGESIQEVFDNIANWETRLPQILDQYAQFLSPDCFDLLQKLLCDPSKRLGANGISEIKSHPFFKGLDWNKLMNEEPPFVPRLADDEDTSYFDSNVQNKNASMIPVAQGCPAHAEAHTTSTSSANGQNPNEYYHQFSYNEADMLKARKK